MESIATMLYERVTCTVQKISFAPSTQKILYGLLEWSRQKPAKHLRHK